MCVAVSFVCVFVFNILVFVLSLRIRKPLP